MSFYKAIVKSCGSSGCVHNYLNGCVIGEEVEINCGVCESYTDERTRFQILKNTLCEYFGPVSESVVNDVCNFIQGKLKSEGQEKEE